MPEASTSAEEFAHERALPQIDTLGPALGAPSPESTRRIALHRLSTTVRALIDLLPESMATDADFDAVAEVLEGEVSRLAAKGRQRHYGRLFDTESGRIRPPGSVLSEHLANRGSSEGGSSDPRRSDGPDGHPFFDHSPVAGLGNPLAPPLRMWIEGDRAIGEATFGSAYEGPPGCVHGGWTAATFDEVLGMAQSLDGHPGMTGRLTIHYRRPTPLYEPIRYEGWIEKVEGRKKTIIGKGYNRAGELLVEADGLFVTVDFEKFRAMIAERSVQAEGARAESAPAEPEQTGGA